MARGTTESVVKEAYQLEIQAGENIIQAADVARETLHLLIFSALSAAKELSANYYKEIYHFDAKAALVQIIEKDYPRLAEKTVALQLGMFATNWKMPTPLKPAKVRSYTRSSRKYDLTKDSKPMGVSESKCLVRPAPKSPLSTLTRTLPYS
jgi:hypothetical protein